jgi:hypothetical protein
MIINIYVTILTKYNNICIYMLICSAKSLKDTIYISVLQEGGDDMLDRVKSSLFCIALITGVLFLLLCSYTTDLWAYTQCEYYYEALLDTDNNVSTGGGVGVVQGGEAPHAIQGIDYRVAVHLNLCSGPNELGPIVILRWNGSAFVEQATYDQHYAIGIENGDVTTPPHYADVIELRALKSDLGNPQGPMKIVYHASRTASAENDYTAAFFYPLRTFAVPSFSHWGIIIFGLLLAISAIWIMKKRNAATVRVLCSLLLVLSIAGVVSANLLCTDKICLDGLIEDWNEISATPSVSDPMGDSSSGDDGEDIFKGYITSDDTNFYFRIDIVGGGIG